MKYEKDFAKKEITGKFLKDKSTYYELSSGETEIINISSNIIEELLDEMKYLREENKRILNEKLNNEEVIEELREKIKELKTRQNNEE